MVASASTSGGGRDKSPHLSKRSLSTFRSEFLGLMQRINFGRIEGLTVRRGDRHIFKSSVNTDCFAGTVPTRPTWTAC